MNRRVFALGSAALAAASPTPANAAQVSDEWFSNPLYRYLDEVVRDGDVSKIEQFIHPDVQIVGQAIAGIDEFRLRCQRDYATRTLEYDELIYVPFAVFADNKTAMIHVEMIAVHANLHETVSLVMLYSARLKDGLIDEMLFASTTDHPELF